MRVKEDFWLKVGAIVLAVAAPFILISTGPAVSLSAYWMTDWRPLFIISNAVTSYYMFTYPKWRISAVFLLGLTAFSMDTYPQFHDLMAYAFFFANLYPLASIRRFAWYSVVYLLAGGVFYYAGMLWGEVYAVIILVAYHLHALLYTHQLLKERRK